jgi:methionyl-tRNA formyltransferase
LGSHAPNRESVLFLGTSEFAVPSLEALVAAGETVALVVTQPDRPRGRGRRREPPPVCRAAERLGLPVFQPEDINAAEAVSTLKNSRPEFLTVVAYGQILKRPVLDVPAQCAVNLHPSLLPRHRGPSPIAWAVLSGDERVGISTMLLDEGLDSGPVLLQADLTLLGEATRGDLEERLSRLGARLLVDTLQALRSGDVEPRPQDPAAANLSRMLTREMRRIDWCRPAAEVQRLIHALSPRPAAAARIGGRLVKILRVRQIEWAGEPGRVVEVVGPGPVIGCGEKAVVLLEVQPEGKRIMSGADFAHGGSARPGDVLQDPWELEEGPDG